MRFQINRVNVDDPGGMLMPGRVFSSASGYRYGFNGQEKSNEIAGEGNSYTAEFWQYDSRIARRWNRDPRPNISISPYATFQNNPIWGSDIKGDTTIFKIYSKDGENQTLDEHKYYNGNLYNSKGEIADLSKIDKSLNANSLKIINSLNQIRGESDFGKFLIDQVTASSTQTELGITTTLSVTGENYILLNYEQSDLIPTTKGTEKVSKNFNAAIVHEFGHLYGSIFKTKESGEWQKLQIGEDDYGNPVFKPISYDEIIGIYSENMYRQQMNLPLRTHYSTDTEGNPIESTSLKSKDGKVKVILEGNAVKKAYDALKK